ncbi:ATP-binding protein [Flavobacterium sp.]|uniref:tetratricopeptide repeat-containing sensor histidine kinase n=1 Tax=Flavobacterium sp. TaxID=239 RepID=UPI0035270C4F
MYCVPINFVCAQQENEDSLLKSWNTISEKPSKRASAFYTVLKNNYENYPDSTLVQAKELLDFSIQHKLPLIECKCADLIGLIYYYMDYNEEAAEYFIKCEKIANQHNFEEEKANNLIHIGLVHLNNWNFNKAIEYFEKALKAGEKINNQEIIALSLYDIGVGYKEKYKTDKALMYYKKSLAASELLQNKSYKINALLGIGDTYERAKKYDSAKIYTNKALQLSKTSNNNRDIARSYTNLVILFFNTKQPDSIIKYANLALPIAEKLHNNFLIQRNIYFLHKAHQQKEDYKRALEYYFDFIEKNDGFNQIKQDRRLQKFELEKQALRDSIKNTTQTLFFKDEITKNKKVKNLITYGWISSFLLLIVIAYFVYKNFKRKQIILEQQKELDIQKLQMRLKNQELNAVDAMVEGQEKERKLIADELHDDLGGLMTTLKIHLESLKHKPDATLYDKTSHLLEQAYQKIRTIAHIKNSGVLADKGLLKAVKSLAESITETNKINVSVIDFELDTRLENSLEISIFRIIQELITNAIKHAKPSEINIYLTKHDTTINIMIEDNGKGFNTKILSKTNGIGIKNIEKKVEQLNGTISIESETNKGTNIIIDLPI